MSDGTVFVTGAGGFLGRGLVERLAADGVHRVVASDLRPPSDSARPAGVEWLKADVRGEGLADLFRHHRASVVVHLASVVSPGADSTREIERSIDVGGTENVLRAAVAAGVSRVVATSSGAVYGYHPDHPEWLTEEHPMRAGSEFAYAHHKRLAEEVMAGFRRRHPELAQVVFRVGTVLGPRVDNAISRLFERPLVLGVRGGRSRWVFVSDEDVAACLARAVDAPVTGVFNLAGDGAVEQRELATLMGKRYVELPAGLLGGALAAGRALGLSRYGVEQVRFLQYRPVLCNRRLKEVFGFQPRATSLEAFAAFWRSRTEGRSRAAT